MLRTCLLFIALLLAASTAAAAAVTASSCAGLSESHCELNACYWYRTYCGPPRTFAPASSSSSDTPGQVPCLSLPKQRCMAFPLACTYVSEYGCLPKSADGTCTMNEAVLVRQCLNTYYARLPLAEPVHSNSSVWCQLAPQLVLNATANCVRKCVDDVTDTLAGLEDIKHWCNTMNNHTSSLPLAMAQASCAGAGGAAITSCNGMVAAGLQHNDEVKSLGTPHATTSSSGSSSSPGLFRGSSGAVLLLLLCLLAAAA